MSGSNSRNLLYFEGPSMKRLFEELEQWQNATEKRLLSIDIQYDDGKYCCIALSNPSEVIICDGKGPYQATVGRSGNLYVLGG